MGLTISVECVVGCVFARIVIVAVATLEEAEVAILTVYIVCNAFKASKEERLTHYVEVAD